MMQSDTQLQKWQIFIFVANEIYKKRVIQLGENQKSNQCRWIGS